MKDPKNPQLNEEDESGGESKGGTTGDIVFHYDVLSESRRDDALPPANIKHALAIHKDLHKHYVDKQKQERKQRTAVKEGKLAPYVAQQQSGYGMGNNNYKERPGMEKFKGKRDKQTTPDNTQNDLKINQELQNQHKLRAQPQLQQKQELRHKKQIRPSPF
jgi:hypothetical protein